MADLEKLNYTINELENQSKTLQQFSGILGKVNDLKDEVNQSSGLLKKTEHKLSLFLKSANTEIDSTLSKIETNTNQVISELNSSNRNNHSKTTDLLKSKLNEIYDDNKRFQKDIDGAMTSKLENNKSNIQAELRTGIRELENHFEKKLTNLQNNLESENKKRFEQQNGKIKIIIGLANIIVLLVLILLALNFN